MWDSVDLNRLTYPYEIEGVKRRTMDKGRIGRKTLDVEKLKPSLYQDRGSYLETAFTDIWHVSTRPPHTHKYANFSKWRYIRLVPASTSNSYGGRRNRSAGTPRCSLKTNKRYGDTILIPFPYRRHFKLHSTRFGWDIWIYFVTPIVFHSRISYSKLPYNSNR